MFDGGEAYAPEAKVSFLSSLVSSPSSAQAAAENLRPSGLPPPAQAEVQSAMAHPASGLLSRCLCAAKGNVRDARRLQAPYRQQHPDYVRRNHVFVRNWRSR